MSSDTTGANEDMALHLLSEIVSGGATVHLLGGGDTMAYGDGSTEIASRSDASVQVAEADWNTTAASGFNDTATLENANELSFGSVDIGVVDQVVIQNDANPNRFVLSDEPNNPDLTGEDVTFSAGGVSHKLGHE